MHNKPQTFKESSRQTPQPPCQHVSLTHYTAVSSLLWAYSPSASWAKYDLIKESVVESLSPRESSLMQGHHEGVEWARSPFRCWRHHHVTSETHRLTRTKEVTGAMSSFTPRGLNTVPVLGGKWHVVWLYTGVTNARRPSKNLCDAGLDHKRVLQCLLKASQVIGPPSLQAMPIMQWLHSAGWAENVLFLSDVYPIVTKGQCNKASCHQGEAGLGWSREALGLIPKITRTAFM